MGKITLHITEISIILLIALLGISQQESVTFYASAYGFVALVSVLFVVAIPILARARSRITLYLLANRRWIGIYTFVFALIHFVVVMNFFFSWNFANALGNTYRFLGLIALLILAAMAATSTNAAMRKMGRNWKRLHYLVYIALLLAIIHSFNIGIVVLSSAVAKIGVAVIVIAVLSWKLYIKARKPKAQSQAI